MTRPTFSSPLVSLILRQGENVFEIDVTKCQHGKGKMSIVAAIIKHSEVARYLKHLGIAHEPPARAPPKYQQEFFEFGSTDDLYESMDAIDG